MATLTEMIPDQALTLEIKGKTYTLAEVDLEMQERIQTKYDIDFLQTGLVWCLENIPSDVKVLRYLLWEMLRENNPELTDEASVGRLIKTRDYLTAMEAVVKTVIASMPIPEDKKKSLGKLIPNLQEIIGYSLSDISPGNVDIDITK